MNIQVGSKIKFLNEDLIGEISAVLANDKLLILASDGFDYTVSIDEIIIINEDNSHHYKVDEAGISKKIISESSPKKSTTVDFLTQYIKTTKHQYEQLIEVDLHLEKLVEFPNKLEDWQKLHTQMQHVKKCLNAAANQKIRKIVFIHGVGTGVLKIELRNYLSQFDNLIVNDGDYREYGMGATEVIIK